jgi:hypothetical protein
MLQRRCGNVGEEEECASEGGFHFRENDTFFSFFSFPFLSLLTTMVSKVQRLAVSLKITILP